MEREIVIDKASGTKVSVTAKEFNGSFHERIPAIPAIQEVTPPPVTPPTVDLTALLELNKAYTEKTGKVATGRWSKDTVWLKAQIDA